MPRARSASQSARLKPACISTSSVCWPSRGAGMRTEPGVRTSFGTMPGTSSSSPDLGAGPQQHVASLVLRIGNDVLDGVDAPGRHPRAVQHRERLLQPCGSAVQSAIAWSSSRHAGGATGVVRQARIGGEIVPAEGAHQALEDAVAVAGDQDPAIAAGIGIARGDAGQRTAGGMADRTEGAVLRQQALHAVEHRLVERHVHHLPVPAVAIALAQGRQHADGAVKRGERIADAHAHAHGHPPRLAGQVPQPAHGFADHAEPRPIPVRAGLAVAGDAQHDQARIDRRQRLVSQPPALQRARAEVLDQHVRVPDQPAHDVLSFGAAKVDRHGALVARLDLPPDRRAVVQQPPLAQRVAGSRRLDLDRVGAEVGQGLAGERPGDQLAELEHAKTGERAGERRPHREPAVDAGRRAVESAGRRRVVIGRAVEQGRRGR